MTELDDAVCELLKSFGIDCYPVSGNVSMKKLGMDIGNEKEVIEFDALAAVQDVGMIIETTEQSKGNKSKINQFYRKANLFIDAHRRQQLNLDVFSLSRAAKNKLSNVRIWKRLYVGTSDELLEKQLIASRFSNRENFLVINSENLSYLKFIADRLGRFGKNEMFEQMNIVLEDHESPSTRTEYTAIHLAGKRISGNIKADVFLFQAPALDLLNRARVPRYGSLKSEIPEYGGDGYQRLLTKKKLLSIADTIKRGGGQYSFPNSITVVLSDDVTVRSNGQDPAILGIPNRYGSIDVIDGQHRLFGYAHAGLSEAKLRQSKIPVIGLQLRGSPDNRNRDMARIFFEINQKQTGVPNDFLYLLSYPVLGETHHIALASHLISRLNTEVSGPLQNVFSTRPFIAKNRSGGRPVKIVMVTNELARLLRPRSASGDGPYHNISEAAWDLYAKGRPNKILDETYSLLDKYFRIVRDNFAEDWDSKESMIFSSKYMMAFTRLFVEYTLNNRTDAQIGKSIATLKNRLVRQSKYQGGEPILLASNDAVPNIKEAQQTVADFILKYGL